LKFVSENQSNVHNYRSTGTPKNARMTGAFPSDLAKGEQRGQWCLFDNNIIGNFMVYHERIETKLL